MQAGDTGPLTGARVTAGAVMISNIRLSTRTGTSATYVCRLLGRTAQLTVTLRGGYFDELDIRLADQHFLTNGTGQVDLSGQNVALSWDLIAQVIAALPHPVLSPRA